jgi:hypothetical protein
MGKAMMQAWGVPLLGCIPDRAFLGMPALADLENLFKSKLVSGKEHRFRHYSTSDINVVTTSLTRFLENLREKPPRYVPCSASRVNAVCASPRPDAARQQNVPLGRCTFATSPGTT